MRIRCPKCRQELRIPARRMTGHDIFISHSKKDKATADALCAILEAKGIRCWIAPRDILPGADWGDAIVGAIEGSAAMVLVFSTHANTSPQVKREVERAVAKGVAIIPLRIEDVKPSGSMEYFISSQHWLDALTPPLEKHLEALAGKIQHILADPAPGPAARSGTKQVEPAPPPFRRRLLWWTAGIFGALLIAVLVLVATQPGTTPRGEPRANSKNPNDDANKARDEGKKPPVEENKTQAAQAVQEATAAALRRWGRNVELDVDRPNQPVISVYLTGKEDAIDDDMKILAPLTEIRFLHIAATSVTDAGLAHLKGLTALEDLDLFNTRITNAGMVHLKGMKALKKLNLDNTRVTDAGLAELKDLTSLEDLNLSASRIYSNGAANKITDAGLEHLKDLRCLRTLSLYGQENITDAGLENLKGLIALETLDLGLTPITDDALARLAPLANLKSLRLSETQIKGSGLMYLRGLKSLRTLQLSNTKLTNEAVKLLEGFPQLETLSLIGTDATFEAVAMLRKKLPTTKIEK
jgi:TIR domain/Leucine rich repeat